MILVYMDGVVERRGEGKGIGIGGGKTCVRRGKEESDNKKRITRVMYNSVVTANDSTVPES